MWLNRNTEIQTKNDWERGVISTKPIRHNNASFFLVCVHMCLWILQMIFHLCHNAELIPLAFLMNKSHKPLSYNIFPPCEVVGKPPALRSTMKSLKHEEDQQYFVMFTLSVHSFPLQREEWKIPMANEFSSALEWTF